MLSQSELVEKFVKHNATRGKASNMFVDGDTLYSYGYHFPLLVRLDWGYLQNADRYSPTTSTHQGLTSRYADALVPFSALSQALTGKRVSGWPRYDRYDGLFRVLFELELVHKVKERHDLIGYQEVGGDRKRISVAQYNHLPADEQRYFIPLYERRPESLILRHKGRYLLSSMDNNRYFISELPEPIDTVDEAFEALKPKELDPNKEWVRQGEWFMQLWDVPETLLWGKGDHKRAYRYLQRQFVLPRSSDSANPHIATRGAIIGDTIVVSGQVRHPEHRMLRLSTTKDPKLFVAYQNRAVQSWSADGRVD